MAVGGKIGGGLNKVRESIFTDAFQREFTPLPHPPNRVAITFIFYHFYFTLFCFYMYVSFVFTFF